MCGNNNISTNCEQLFTLSENKDLKKGGGVTNWKKKKKKKCFTEL